MSHISLSGNLIACTNWWMLQKDVMSIQGPIKSQNSFRVVVLKEDSKTLEIGNQCWEWIGMNHIDVGRNIKYGAWLEWKYRAWALRWIAWSTRSYVSKFSCLHLRQNLSGIYSDTSFHCWHKCAHSHVRSHTGPDLQRVMRKILEESSNQIFTELSNAHK